ncbi:MAG: hypothetical protein JO091_12890, partial [Acidobacteriaceae bacterium]|nr:hypothetical protein [Acidobacteriaceae bacterium]
MQSPMPALFAASLALSVVSTPALLAQQASDHKPVAPASSSSATVPLAAAPDVKKPGDSKNASESIHVTVNEVIVPVTVTDEKGRFVSDLDEKDFHVFEENKPQTIRYFTRERSQPVVIGFLLDLSTASRIHWKNFQDATTELIQNLLTGDAKYSGYLIDYA